MSKPRNWEVKFFQTIRSTSPIKEFIKDQDESTYAKILHAILLLRNNGPYLKPPQMKKIQRNLYELRIRGKISIRIFYTFFNDKYYLLHIFKKKSQKTPAKEIKIAIDRIRELI